MLKFNGLILELSVTSLEKSLDFYMEDLCFKVEYSREGDRFFYIPRRNPDYFRGRKR